MSDPVVRALVAGHADFAAGLISAVELITGRGDQLMPIQVRGLCGTDIELLLAERLTATESRVIFTDLHAGSCTMAARRVQRAMPGVMLVAGANLPMLLDFVMNADADPSRAATQAADRGKTAVSVIGGAP